MEFGKNKDEIQQYIDARYVSAHKAFWRLLENEIHTQIPAVIALPVHLENHQSVIFDGMEGPEEALDAAHCSKTKLMAQTSVHSHRKEGTTKIAETEVPNTDSMGIELLKDTIDTLVFIGMELMKMQDALEHHNDIQEKGFCSLTRNFRSCVVSQ
ncbi:hypothetical protein BU17DRAFT_85753 [Hysterangium stoloniferum]|nr:hypothetical protein BU17DRAFT_85753 [Hysterangium stoloniferum]